MESVSRRSFVTGSATLGALVSVPLTLNVAHAAEDATAEGAPAEETATAEVAVHDVDILIVGGGLAGCSAARAAMGMGKRVCILDKGQWGHSGTSGINWGHDAMSSEYAESSDQYVMDQILNADGMLDQALYKHMAEVFMKYRQNYSIEQLGMVTERSANGSFTPGLREGYFNRYLAQFVKRMGAEIHDRTHVLDFLVADDGSVAGAVALDMASGQAHVYRAKAVIMAMGSFAWISGWNGIAAHTIASPENTGDGQGFLIRHGVAMRDMEQEPTDFTMWTPAAIRQGMGGMGASIVNIDRLYDKNGDPILTEEMAAQLAGGTFYNAEVMRLGMGVIYRGDGGPNCGIFVDVTDLETQDRYYRHAPANLAKLGYVMPDMVELCEEQWETAGRAWDIDPDTCEIREIPNLFFAGAAPSEWHGNGYFGSASTGYISGEGASARVDEREAASPVPWDQVSAILSDAYGIMANDPADPIRATDVFRHVQEAYWSYIGTVRNEAGLNAGLAELDRIEAEELPRMMVPCKSMVMNSDWRQALEVKNLIACARGAAHASLIRKESRGALCRDDYPALDNENFLCNTKVQCVDGQWTAELTDLIDTVISHDDLQAYWAEKGETIGFPIE